MVHSKQCVIGGGEKGGGLNKLPSKESLDKNYMFTFLKICLFIFKGKQDNLQGIGFIFGIFWIYE